MPAFRLFDHWRASNASGLVIGIFVLLFVGVAGWLEHDRLQVLEATANLRTQTMPKTLAHQRVARNLEQLRLEGERIFAGASAESRQHAFFVATLIASHPSLLEDARSASLVRETEAFLALVAREPGNGPPRNPALHAEWQRHSTRLSLLADDLSAEGVNLAAADIAVIAEAVRLSRLKLIAAFALAAVFIVLAILLFRHYLLHPLHRIDRALRGGALAAGAAHGRLAEIEAIEQAVAQVRATTEENARVRRELEHLARHDALTGLFNRRHFLEQARAELERDRRYRRPAVVGMADLDHFKRVNDTYGHAAGDAVLQAFAERVRDSVRQSDLVCRYGGEEFAFLFPETTLDEAQRLAERIRGALRESAIAVGDAEAVPVTVSIGLADATNGSLDQALNAADEAMYQAKRLGRDRVHLAAPPAPRLVARRL